MEYKIVETSSSISKTGLYETALFQVKSTKVFVTKFTSTCGLSDCYNVKVLNASARAWGGVGKIFANIDEALDHYKGKNMQAILNSLKN